MTNEVGLNPIRDAKPREAAVAGDAPPMRTIGGKVTGWKQVPYPNADGLLLISSDGKKAVEFPSANPRSGVESLRAAANAQIFAIENPYFAEDPEPQLIQIGDYVRSFDFAHSKDCYVEGLVLEICRPEGATCDTYRIDVARRVWQGASRPVRSTEREVFPPINGIPTMRGGLTNFVERTDPPAPKSKPAARSSSISM